MRREDKLEQGRRNTQIRRDTAIRGSMGTPASGMDSPTVTSDNDLFKERMRGSGESGDEPRSSREPHKLPLPD